MSFMIKDDNIKEVWSKIKKALNVTFHSMLVYDEKHIKLKENNLIV